MRAAAAADKKKIADVTQLKPMLRYLKPYRGQIVCAVIAIIFTSSAVLGLGQALRYLVDEGLGKQNPALLDRAFWFLMAVTLLLAFATYARFWLVTWVGERVVADIRNEVYRHLLYLDVSFYETARTGELVSRLSTDTTLLQTVIGSSVSVAARNVLMLIGGVLMLLFTSLKLTAYVFVILPLVVVPILVLGRRVRALSRATQQRVAEMSAHTEETIGAIRTIAALSLEPYETGRFAALVQSTLSTARARIRLRALLTAIVITLVFGAIITVLWIGGRDVLAGRISAGDLSAFVFFSVLVAGAVGALSEVVGDLLRAAGAAERLMELLQEKSRIAAPATPAPLPAVVQGEIVFNNVTFHYPSRPEHASLQNIALHIPPGETVALVGPSGAGKTTLFQLLLRFYDPSGGSIKIDGVKLDEADPAQLRGIIGLVPQDPVIFSADVWENIRCGRLDATEDEIIEAARQAAALEFIEALPEGFRTFLGEKGVRLSGGQRQRLAIARALLRQPAILLLDEATSALDAEHERAVQQALTTAMKGRTTLVIAHRLATVQRAHRIVVLDQGKIVAEGTHEMLMQRSPLYARLATLQLLHT